MTEPKAVCDLVSGCNADGLFLFDKAESGSDCLRVPTDVNLIARLVTVTKVVTPSGTHAVPVIEWRTDYQATLAALIRVLQRHRKLDPSFHPTIETKSRNGMQKVIDLKEAPGQISCALCTCLHALD